MTKLLKTITFLLALVFVLSCSKDDELDVDDSYVIEFETLCGWNIGNKFIFIEKGEIKYGSKVVFVKTKSLSSKAWKELIASFDINLFENLDYNTCNVCVDGCDEIIRITSDDNSHEIRYNPGDTIPGLEDLQKKLRAYMTEIYPD